eukprot:Nk52_evm43s2496 gene=Nk52_evmTU43s2496
MEDIDDASDLYYFGFSSDHYSLKSSAEYRTLIQTLAALEQQQSTAIKALDRLLFLRKECMDVPEEFVKRVRENRLEIPEAQKLVKVPEIDFAKFGEEGEAGVGGVGGDRKKKPRTVNNASSSNNNSNTNNSANLNSGSKSSAQSELAQFESLAELHPEVLNAPEYQQLIELLRRKKYEEDTEKLQHMGFKCDGCGCEPIMGIRWTCNECPEGSEVDLCNACYSKGDFRGGLHMPHHTFKGVDKEEAPQFQDVDYVNFQQDAALTEYNYLDPNFNPV